MADDEPLDDARAVGTAAAAAAARVVETVAREARDHAAQHRATLERQQDQQRAQDTLAQLGHRAAPEMIQAVRTGPTELEQAEAWAGSERLQQQWSDREGCDSAEGRASVDMALVREWKAATAPYDSRDRREAADGVRAAAGVPADARQVRATADLMNGTSPTRAAAQAQPAHVAARPPLQRGTEVTRGR